MLAICTYSLDKCDGTAVIDVVKNHQFALVKQDGKWDIIESSIYKQAKETLRETEDRYRSLFSSMTEGVCEHEVIYDHDGNAVDYMITGANQSFETITGLRIADTVGVKASETYGAMPPPYLDLYAKVAATQQPCSFETYYPPMGKHFNISAFSPGRGKFVTVFSDITERKKAEETVERNKRKLDEILSSIQDDIYVLDRDWNFVYVSLQFAGRMGKEPGDFVGKNIWTLLPKYVGTELEENYRATMDTRETMRFEHTGLYTEAWYRMTVFPSAEGITVLGTDITALKKTDAELLRINRELRAISDCDQAIVRAREEKSLCKTVCRIMCETVGYCMAWVGIVEQDDSKTVRPLAWHGENAGYLETAAITWADTDRGRGATGVAARTGRTDFCQDFSTEPKGVPWRDAALARGFHSSIAIPIRDANGEVFAVFTLYAAEANGFTPSEVELLEGLTEDLSFGIWVLRGREQRRRMNENLRETRDFLDNLMNYASAPIIVWNPQYQITRFNHSFERLVGMTEEEVVGKPLDILFPEDSRQASMRPIQEALAGERWEGVEIPIIQKDRAPRILLWNSATIYAADGKTPVATIAQGQDITDRKQSEVLKDEFIGMVSHELKTPLTVVTGAINVAMSDGIPEDERKSLLEDAAWGAESMADIVDNLLELSRWQSSRLVLQSASLDIGQIVRSLVEVSSKKSSKHVVVADVHGALPAIRADRIRIERILDNLIDNAIKYSPGGGEVKVSAYQEGDQIAVSVRDQGVGISRADIEKLFQPFSRLETPVQGTAIKGIGLGLVVCLHLVEAHGGRIWVESEPGIGSTFYFTLPTKEP